jgi:ribosomal protein L32E
MFGAGAAFGEDGERVEQIWRNWPAMSSATKRSVSSQPTMPAVKTRRPAAAMPLE